MIEAWKIDFRTSPLSEGFFVCGSFSTHPALCCTKNCRHSRCVGLYFARHHFVQNWLSLPALQTGQSMTHFSGFPATTARHQANATACARRKARPGCLYGTCSTQAIRKRVACTGRAPCLCAGRSIRHPPNILSDRCVFLGVTRPPGCFWLINEKPGLNLVKRVGMLIRHC